MTAATENQMEGAGSRDLPPTYNDTVSQAISQGTATAQAHPSPGPATEGSVYNSVPGDPSIRFWIHPFRCKDSLDQPWVGQIMVKCSDVPLLMREGFHWTVANIIKEEGYVENIRPQLADMRGYDTKYRVTRYWFLQDLQQPPRWTASFQAHCWDTEVASKIRLEDWTTDMIHSTHAYGVSGKLIYRFYAMKGHMQYSINVIYDSMPLEGWWPWPKKS
ncbi:hypothetical protein GGR54DRAFT_179491 [Hypoxylon sp. NC1633]|nr:hypothetical protein GGR54DRAFT_179491 [Hypoxylon sp. NC1633]